MCVDCKIACSDQACPGIVTDITIFNPCDTSCANQMASYAALRFDIEQSSVYPSLTPLSLVTSRTSIEVQSSVTEPASVYCGAFPYYWDGSEPLLNSIYQVKKAIEPGVGFTNVATASGDTPFTVQIYGLAPQQRYRVVCYT